MRRLTQWLLVLAVILWSSCGARSQVPDPAKIEISTQKIASSLYVLTGSPGVDPGHEDAAGGRITVFEGPEGVFVVDAQYSVISDKVLAAIRKITTAPIRFLVDTHSHPDHASGNAGIVKAGALLFAREEARNLILHPNPPLAAVYYGNDPARLPVVTFGMGAPLKIRINGEIIDLVPMPHAHTSGDTIIRFENTDAIAIGDIYRNYGYPFIDIGSGGTLKGLLQALDEIIQLAGPDTVLIPGHGTLVRRADIVAYRDMILAIQAEARSMIEEGKSEADIFAAKLTARYDSNVKGGADPLFAGTSETSADRFVGEIYSELKTGR